MLLEEMGPRLLLFQRLLLEPLRYWVFPYTRIYKISIQHHCENCKNRITMLEIVFIGLLQHGSLSFSFNFFWGFYVRFSFMIEFHFQGCR